MELENHFILIAGFAGSCCRHCHINIYCDPKLGQVSLFTSGLSDAIMLELFKETPNDVTYTLKCNGTRKYLLNRSAFFNGQLENLWTGLWTGLVFLGV